MSNPEVTVVETNLDRAAATGKLDVDYLDSMSDDALPTLIAGIDTLPPEHADDLFRRLCTTAEDRWGSYGRSHVEVDRDGTVRARSGWAAYNTSRQAAARAVQRCADGLAGG